MRICINYFFFLLPLECVCVCVTVCWDISMAECVHQTNTQPNPIFFDENMFNPNRKKEAFLLLINYCLLSPVPRYIIFHSYIYRARERERASQMRRKKKEYFCVHVDVCASMSIHICRKFIYMLLLVWIASWVIELKTEKYSKMPKVGFANEFHYIA